MIGDPHCRGRRAIAVLSLVVLYGALALAGWWGVVDTKPPLRIESIVAVDDSYQAGGVLRVRSKYCIDYDLPGTVRRSIVGNAIHLLPEVGSTTEPGCRTEVFTIDLPRTLAPGKYFYHPEFDYQLNPLVRRTVVGPMVPFTVVEDMP